MSRETVSSLTTSLVATGLYEIPILAAHIHPPPETARHPQPSTVPPKSAPVTSVLSKFRGAARSSSNAVDCFQRLHRALTPHVILNGVWWLAREPDNAALKGQPMTVLAKLDNDASQCLWQAKQAEFNELAQKALADNPMVIARAPNLTNVAIRLETSNDRATTLVFSLGNVNDPVAEGLCLAMAWALEQFLLDREHELVRREIQSLSDWTQLQCLIDRSHSTDEAAIVLVNYLKSLLNVGQVALVLAQPRGKRMHVAAVSDLDRPDPSSQANKSIVLAAQSVPDDSDVAIWPPPHSASVNEIAFKQCASWFGSEAVLIWRLRHAEKTSGFLAIGCERRQVDQPALHRYLSVMAPLLASHLALVRQAHASAWHRCQQVAWRLWSDRRHRIVRYSIACVALAMAIPWPYRVSTPCQLELVKRRLVAAPFDGLLETCLVRNGDTVSQGQRLAIMDGRHLRLELASKQAELAAQQKRRESYLARGDVAQSQIAQQQAIALQADIDLLHRQLQELEIRSPTAGVVISGDLEKVEGAPLKAGDALFEIGPLDEVIVELEIPDSDVRFIQVGQQVTVTFDAFPLSSWQGKIVRLHPRSELRRNANVFVAEVPLPNDDFLLRPGLRGRARIFTGWSPLGWNLFHKAIERVASLVAW